MMASAQVVETSVNTNNSPSQDYTKNPDDHSNHNKIFTWAMRHGVRSFVFLVRVVFGTHLVYDTRFALYALPNKIAISMR